MVNAMTHIDRLSPVREWAPSYDIASPARPKAALIRQAMTQVAQVLETADDDLVPLSLREGEPPCNLEALWAAIASKMSDAQTTALDRALKKIHGLSLKTTFQQCCGAGRSITSKLWHHRLRSAFKA